MIRKKTENLQKEVNDIMTMLCGGHLNSNNLPYLLKKRTEGLTVLQ